MTVARLPVQHRLHPHCATCNNPLPRFDNVVLSSLDASLGGYKVLAIKFDVRCKCGSEWILKKKVKP